MSKKTENIDQEEMDNTILDKDLEINDDNATEIQDVNLEDADYQSVESQVAEARDKYIRLLAEFDNYKKRVSKERIELIQTAGKETIVAMLPILDDIDRAEKNETLSEGIALLLTKFRNTLTQKGVKELESTGKPFDPELHEAITEIPAPNPSMVGIIVDTIDKGYFLNDKLIRFAKVVVGK
jgi:molecular chaperone GrpE